MPNEVLEQLAANQTASVDRLKALLSIPSVATDPAFHADTRKAADWVVAELQSFGMTAQACKTDGQPIVLATAEPSAAAVAAAKSAGGAGSDSDDVPHVLFYGHYDVQPPDPIELWESGPFEPVIKDGAIVARGAADDKGQICTFFESLRAWFETHGGPPVRVTVVIEGEEESGSSQLKPFLQKHADQLRKADIVLISDTMMWDAETPAITYALRGLLYFDIKLHAFSRDLHSGMYGGTIANPCNTLTTILGKLFDDKHRVTIPGFYDDVVALDPVEREEWSKLPFDEAKYLKSIAAAEPYGEAGYDTLERKWARPACDINGIYGGYAGEGAKTVIAGYAGAKVSFRLAANQDPKKIAEAFKAWLSSHDVHGGRWEVTFLGDALPVMTPTDSPYVGAAIRALERSATRPPVLIREGATIPVVSDFKTELGLDSLLIGFSLDSDRIHSPNEKFDLACFNLGCRTHVTLLEEFAKLRK